MRYEYSHEHTREVFEVPIPRLAPLVSAPPAPVTKVVPAVNRGCVLTTALALVGLSSFSFLSFCGALTLDLPLAALANVFEAALYMAVGVGLMNYRRWAANLMVLVSTLIVLSFVIPRAIVMLEAMRLYVTEAMARLMLGGMLLAMGGVLALVMSFVAWWFWDRRVDFLPSPIVDGWGYRLYWTALLVATFILVAEGLTTYQLRAEELEPQVGILRQLNQMSQQSW